MWGLSGALVCAAAVDHGIVYLLGAQATLDQATTCCLSTCLGTLSQPTHILLACPPAGGSSLAGYAEYTAAAAAAAGSHGSPYSAGYRTAWAAGGAPSKFSNGVVAAVLFIPLVVT